MSNSTETPKKAVSWKIYLAATAAILAILVIVFLMVQQSGYKKAQAEYQNMVAEQKAEIESLKAELADPVTPYEIVTTEVDMSLLESRLEDIGELATIEYLYTDAGRFSNTKTIKNFKLPGTTKYFTAKWSGAIKVGVDITKLKVEKDDEKKTITVQLPPAKILSHQIDFDNVEVLDEKDGLFNKVEVEDSNTLYATNMKAMETRVKETSLMDKASKNAEALVAGIVNSVPGVSENYQVTVTTK